MRTSELIDTALDWAVSMIVENSRKFPIWLDGKPSSYAAYSTDWAQGGPIIERERIWVCASSADAGWFAEIGKSSTRKTGPTPLVAAMRCYVASKLGDEVEIPEELSNG